MRIWDFLATPLFAPHFMSVLFCVLSPGPGLAAPDVRNVVRMREEKGTHWRREASVLVTEGVDPDSGGLGSVAEVSGRGREFGAFWSVLESSFSALPCSLQEGRGEAEAVGPALCQPGCLSVYAHATPENPPGHCRECLPYCSGERLGAQRRRHWPGAA